MNNTRRKQIKMCIDKLEAIKTEIENIKSDEEDYFDNMPENLQGSIRGSDAEEAIEALEEAIDDLDIVIEDLEGIG